MRLSRRARAVDRTRSAHLVARRSGRLEPDEFQNVAHRNQRTNRVEIDSGQFCAPDRWQPHASRAQPSRKREEEPVLVRFSATTCSRAIGRTVYDIQQKIQSARYSTHRFCGRAAFRPAPWLSTPRGQVTVKNHSAATKCLAKSHESFLLIQHKCASSMVGERAMHFRVARRGANFTGGREHA
jgi:hypothetical protein